MESIGQILQKSMDNLQNQNDSTPGNYLTVHEISNLPVYVTPGEAIQLGFKLVEPIPVSTACEHCGAELKIIGRRKMLRSEISAWVRHQECTCETTTKIKEETAAAARVILEQEAAATRRQEFNNRVKRLFDQSKLGARFLNRTFENYQVNDKNKTAFDTARNYAADFEKLKKEGVSLIFNGPMGTGKTHLAAAIAIDLISRGIPVIMGNVITLLGMIKETYSGKGSENEIIDLYSTVELLIIDDLGKEKVTEWTLEKLYLIINNRYENNLPVIITTNSDIEGLNTKLSTERNRDTAEAITSRLWEMCLGVRCEWEDWRKK